MFRRNIPPLPSELKAKFFTCSLPHVGFLLDLLYNPEDGNDTLFRNVGSLLMDYTALYLGRQNSS
jgi:hypothetical protein